MDELDLAEVEREICRLPDVSIVRMVADPNGRISEVHVVAHQCKHPKQIVRDVQSIALASFGLELDRRTISVVQLGGTILTETAVPGPRPSIIAITAEASGLRSLVRVTLALDEEEDLVGPVERVALHHPTTDFEHAGPDLADDLDAVGLVALPRRQEDVGGAHGRVEGGERLGVGSQPLAHFGVWAPSEQYSLGHNDSRPSADGQVRRNVLHEENLRRCGMNREVCLEGSVKLSAVWRVRQDYAVLIFLWHVWRVKFEGVR
jgi:hypothetical protein